MSFVTLYVTCADRAEALAIGRAVVGDRLAACANVLDGMRSVYWWEGALSEGDEAVLLLKTRRDLVDAASARVKGLHSYATPCIVAWPIVAGSGDYLDWLAAETATPKA